MFCYKKKTWLPYAKGQEQWNNQITKEDKNMNVLCLSDGFDEEDQSHLLIMYKKCCLLSIYLFYIEIIKTNPSDNKITDNHFFILTTWEFRCFLWKPTRIIHTTTIPMNYTYEWDKTNVVWYELQICYKTSYLII